MKLLFFLAVFSVCILTAVFGEQLVNDEKKIGKINGKDIYLRQLKDAEIQKLLSELYLQILTNFRDKSLENIDILLPAISNKEVKKFYDDNQLQERGSFEDIRVQIKTYMMQILLEKKREVEFTKLVAEKKVKFLLTEPDALLLRLPIATAYLRGNHAAKVMLLEFSDYQCPFCKQNQPVISSLIQKYKTEVVFGYRHFPLSFHKEAKKAALAVECAREQGEFEAFHVLLFADSNDLSNQKLLSYAKSAGIKKSVIFNDCLSSKKYSNLLKNDEQAALALGINATPSYIIGRVIDKGILEGQLVVGAVSQKELTKIIQKYLQAASL